MKKIYISQPMRGRATDEIIAERKALIADAAVELRTDDLEVLGTYRGVYNDKHPPASAGMCTGKDGRC